jgi:excisionase family DNA binding protein
METRLTRLTPINLESKVLVSVDEAAALLSLGRTMVYTLVMSGDLPSIKIGRMRRIPVAALHAYVSRQLAMAS